MMMTTMTKRKPEKESSGLLPSGRLFFRIGDVASIVGVKPYVLRYWETEFPQVSPKKALSGHRVYQRGEVERLLLIKKLLHEERYSIEGAKKKLRELRGADFPEVPVRPEVIGVREAIAGLRAWLEQPVDLLFRV